MNMDCFKRENLGGCPRIEEPTAEKPFQSDSPIKCVKYTQYKMR